MTIPPSDGPTTEANWNIMAFRLIAFGRCSRGTSVGTSACRAGRSKVLIDAPIAVSTKSGHTTDNPRNASTASPSEMIAAAVPHVGDHPADHREDDDRHEANQAHRSECQCFPLRRYEQ